MCYKHNIHKGHEKFLPQGITQIFTKREETFPGKVSRENSGENVATLFFGKVFPAKVSYENIVTQTL